MYRTDVDIVTQILEITANGGSNTTKSKIMDGALLSHAQLKNYLTILTESDLLQYDDGLNKVTITEAGIRFLKIYNQID
jgi:predicted transcriptional regulator